MLCNFHTFFIILNLCIDPVVSLFHFFLTYLTVFYPIYTNLPREKISSMKNVQTFFHIHKLSTFHSHKNCPFLQLFTELCTLSTFLPWKTMTFQPLFFKHTFCLFLRFSIFYNFFVKSIDFLIVKLCRFYPIIVSLFGRSIKVLYYAFCILNSIFFQYLQT